MRRRWFILLVLVVALVVGLAALPVTVDAAGLNAPSAQIRGAGDAPRTDLGRMGTNGADLLLNEVVAFFNRIIYFVLVYAIVFLLVDVKNPQAMGKFRGVLWILFVAIVAMTIGDDLIAAARSFGSNIRA